MIFSAIRLGDLLLPHRAHCPSRSRESSNNNRLDCTERGNGILSWKHNSIKVHTKMATKPQSSVNTSKNMQSLRLACLEIRHDRRTSKWYVKNIGKSLKLADGSSTKLLLAGPSIPFRPNDWSIDTLLNSPHLSRLLSIAVDFLRHSMRCNCQAQWLAHHRI